jgi:hypothetical protein
LYLGEGIAHSVTASEGSTSLPKEAPYFFYSKIDHIGFIRKEPIEPSGVIFKVRGDHQMISTDDIVYIRNTVHGPLNPGSRFSIYRISKPLTDIDSGEYVGIQHYLTGVVEILKKEPRFAVAKVVQSFHAIKLNDMIMPYVRRSPKIWLRESQKGCYGKIIASEEHASIIGDNTVAFIDVGAEHGIAPGQIYSIFYQDTGALLNQKERVLLPPVDFGKIVVLHTESHTSTVLITNVVEEIHAGSRICTPFEQ